MTYHYGAKSLEKLNTCSDALQRIAERALSYGVVDITIVWGWRNEEQQNGMYYQTPPASTKRFPESKHNHTEDGQPYSLALDFAPWVDGGIPWNDTHAFAMVAGLMKAAASELGYKIRWGGDWDSDGRTTDQTFMDYGHIEEVRT